MNIREQEWEAYVNENGSVYVEDIAGNTICDLHYLTDRVDRETGKRLVHTFHNAEEHVKLIAAIPEMMRELRKAHIELLEAADKFNVLSYDMKGSRNIEFMNNSSDRAANSAKDIYDFVTGLEENHNEL